MCAILTDSTQIELLIFSMSAVGAVVALTAIMQPIREFIKEISLFSKFAKLLVLMNLLAQVLLIFRILGNLDDIYILDFAIISLLFISSAWALQLLVPLVFYRFESEPQSRGN